MLVRPVGLGHYARRTRCVASPAHWRPDLFFKEGLILSTELIDVENRLTDSKVRRTLARAANRIALADLRRAIGLDQFTSLEEN